MKNRYKVSFQTKWSDFDPNNHMRHTAYNDYAAQVRIFAITSNNFSLEDFTKHNIGPILFREETFFLKEIRLNEVINVDVQLLKLSPNGRKFSMVHYIYNEKGEKAAKIIIDGAWIDLGKRKVCMPPLELFEVLKKIPKIEE